MACAMRSTPSWGNMLTNSLQYVFRDPWLVILPGAFIFVTILSVYLLADGLRDALDAELGQYADQLAAVRLSRSLAGDSPGRVYLRHDPQCVPVGRWPARCARP